MAGIINGQERTIYRNANNEIPNILYRWINGVMTMTISVNNLEVAEAIVGYLENRHIDYSGIDEFGADDLEYNGPYYSIEIFDAQMTIDEAQDVLSDIFQLL